MHVSSIQSFVWLIILVPFSFPNFITSVSKTFGTWNVCLEDKKNITIHNVVIEILVAKMTIPTTYAPFNNAIIPANIDNKPAASTSVTISTSAIQVAFESSIPFFFK